MNFRFPPQHRLKDNRTINHVLTNGKKFYHYPLLFLTASIPPREPQEFNPDPKAQITAPPLQIAFSVPKRRVRKAVLRNRIKRQMREAFRLQQHLYLESNTLPAGSTLGVVVIFIGNELPRFEDLRKAYHRFLKRL